MRDRKRAKERERESVFVVKSIELGGECTKRGREAERERVEEKLSWISALLSHSH